MKLTDFGISRELATAVLAGTFVGSFKYMSPERMQSQPYSYSSGESVVCRTAGYWASSALPLPFP